MATIKTILITGVAGFIGSNFAKWILKNTDDCIVGIDDLSSGYEENLPKGFESRFCCYFRSVNDINFLNSLFATYLPKVTYHLAAYAAEGRSNHIRAFNHKNNTLGTANVINCCVNHNSKLIFTSSVAVYSGPVPYNEGTQPKPIDEYGVSKYSSELSIQIAGENQGLDWVILRPRNVYGPGQSIWDPARNVFGIWMYAALHNEPAYVFGDGNNTRAFTYIDDILRPMYKAANISKEIINIGALTGYRIADAALILMQVTTFLLIKQLPKRHEVKDAICMVDKSEKLLGFKQTTGLLEGLTKMWAWVKEQPAREKQIPPPLEITKNAHASLI